MWILLIEDEPRIRAFIARGLGAEGFTVDERDDGQLGLRRALEAEYDLVVLDLQLPSLDGLSVLRVLSRQRPQLPVLILSGRSDLRTRLAASATPPHPDWVSYLARDPHGKWVHSTVLRVPAYSTVDVTIYQFDTATGLRNPFWGQPRGTIGGTINVDGKTLNVLNPDLASHTFAIPDLRVSVPLKGLADDAKNQCSVAPCSLSEAHTTVKFSFQTGKPGKLRWQCFVPCAAGFPLGFGGPMQSLGWMDGYLEGVG